MKKIFLLLSFIIFLTACDYSLNEPKDKTEALFLKYNKLNDNVIRDLDIAIVNAGIEEENYELVNKAFKRQYKDLKYKITKYSKNKDKAVIEAKITVYNYKKEITESNKYIKENINKFITDNEINKGKLEKYIYNNCLNTKKRINYKINIYYYKANNKWTLKPMNSEVISKINGTY